MNSLVAFMATIIGLSAAAVSAQEAARGKPAVGDEKLGGKTPEAAFERFKSAVKKDDWETAFRVTTDDCRDFLIGSLTIGMQLGVLGAEGKSLVRRFVDPDKLQAIISEMMALPRDKQRSMIPKAAALVSKRAALMTSALKEFEKQKSENWLNIIKHAKSVRLEKIQINGTTARAVIRFHDETSAGGEDTQLRRVKGRWFLDYQSR